MVQVLLQGFRRFEMPHTRIRVIHPSESPPPARRGRASDTDGEQVALYIVETRSQNGLSAQGQVIQSAITNRAQREPDVEIRAVAPTGGQMDTVMERNHILDARDRAIAQTKSRAWLHA